MMGPMAAAKTHANPSKGLNIALWVGQLLLFAVFATTGLMKLVMSAEKLAGMMPVGLARFIGTAELAGALGVLLPALTRIKPALTPLAALGLVVVMVLAAGFHLSRGETAAALVPVVLGAVAAFVAWGRFRRAPLTPRRRA